MSEIETYNPHTVAVPDGRDTDSWIAVCSDVIKVANVIYDTPFVPEGLRGSAPAVAAAILAGRELGIGPMTALQHIHVIKGKPAQSAALMRALIQAAGHQLETVDISDTRAVVRGRRKGESGWEQVAFTADQAKKAQIDLGKYPEDKLYARATSRLARRKFADVIAGMPYSAEELEDGDTEPVTPAPDGGQKPPEPKPRTARRKQAEHPAPEPESEPAAPEPAASEPPQPPLPGEDEAPERDYDTHGTATRGRGGQLTALWTVLSTVYGFTDDEKPLARGVCEHIIGRQLAGDTTGDLSFNEARTVLDTLANWQEVAQSQEESPRDVLIAAMAAGADDG